MPPATAFTQISQLASMRRVHEAFRWLHLHERQIMSWQRELVAIAAPPFAEDRRARWLLERFAELGLEHPHLDGAGNALAVLPASSASAVTLAGEPGDRLARDPLILISAHLDTVFPAETPLEPVLEGTRLEAPGACDNGAGVVALLALAAALRSAGLAPGCPIVFAGNVGEEGEGDLRGTRALYAQSLWAHRIRAHVVLDGAGDELAVTRALGSRRFRVTVRGHGGHSWTDARRPNAIVALCSAISAMAHQARAIIDADDLAPEESPLHEGAHPVLSFPGRRFEATRSSWNVGTVEGGSGVTAVPECASARFDLRSTDPSQLLLLEVALHRAVEDAVAHANHAAEEHGDRLHRLTFAVEPIGNRPAGSLREGAVILDMLRSVDRHLRLRTDIRTASTDANIPLSLGVEALSLGAGGSGGGVHTRAEWYDSRGRDVGLRRALLLLLALAAHHSPEPPKRGW